MARPTERISSAHASASQPGTRARVCGPAAGMGDEAYSCGARCRLTPMSDLGEGPARPAGGGAGGGGGSGGGGEWGLSATGTQDLFVFTRQAARDVDRLSTERYGMPSLL